MSVIDLLLLLIAAICLAVAIWPRFDVGTRVSFVAAGLLAYVLTELIHY